MRSMLIIGLGRFGQHLAKKLMELGNEVMVVDKEEAPVDEIAPMVTRAQIGDCMDPEVIQSLGPASFDVCFVCISENFQSSLEITWLLKEQGAQYVVAKSDRALHAKFLLRIGADDVVYPERDMAQRTAVKYSTNGNFDYIELSGDFAITELPAPAEWVGHDLRSLDLRARYGVNVIALKQADQVLPMVDVDYQFQASDHLLVAASRQDLMKLSKLL